MHRMFFMISNFVLHEINKNLNILFFWFFCSKNLISNIQILKKIKVIEKAICQNISRCFQSFSWTRLVLKIWSIARIWIAKSNDLLKKLIDSIVAIWINTFYESFCSIFMKEFVVVIEIEYRILERHDYCGIENNELWQYAYLFCRWNKIDSRFKIKSIENIAMTKKRLKKKLNSEQHNMLQLPKNNWI